MSKIQITTAALLFTALTSTVSSAGEPSEETVAEAIKTYSALGAKHREVKVGEDGVLHVFRFSAGFDDVEVTRLRDLSFEFGLSLRDSAVSDEGVKSLTKLKHLRVLDLGNMTRFTGEALGSLSEFENLQELWLSGSPISDKGVEAISKIESLRVLSLRAASATDFAVLRKLPNLETLYLDHSMVGDAGLRSISKIPKLRALDLSSTKVTDAGVANLKGSTSLAGLDLRETSVSEAMLKELREALPKCKIRK